ncbi:hypothetical protein JCM10449v2_004500 [Rhodotorula kratochvilovae]
MDELRKIPPFTRTVVLGVLATTLPVILQLVSPYRVAFVPHRIAQNWELQRLVLPFLFGGSGIQLVFSLIMLYRSLNELEEGHFSRRLADISWAFILICGGIIVRHVTLLPSLPQADRPHFPTEQGLNTPLQNPWLFSPFMLAVTHLWAQANAMNQVNLYGLLTLPAPYFPFAMLGMDLLQGGPGAALRSFTGMVAAHAWWFLAVIYPRQNGGSSPALLRALLAPPQALINLLGNGPAVPSSFAGSGSAGAGGYRVGGGTAFRPAAGAPGAAAAAAGRGVAGATGARAGGERTATHRWGSGHRLGSD